MKIIHGYGAISKWRKRRKSEDFLPQLLWWYHANFVTDEYDTIVRFVHAHAMCGSIYDTMPTFNFFRVHLKCFNALWFGPHNTINPVLLLVNYVLKRAATWAIGPGSSGPFGPGSMHEPGPMRVGPGPWPILQRIQILTIQISKLMALTESS